MIEVLNWFAVSETRIVVGLASVWMICEFIAIPIKAWRKKD